MSGLRVLVTAGASRLGALVVGALERDPRIGTLVAVDERPPGAPFAVAEFVRLAPGSPQLPRIVRGAAIDVLVDLRPAAAVARQDDHELGDHAAATRRIAAVIQEDRSPLRRVVAVGSVHRYGWHRDLPTFVTEETPPRPPRSARQRALAEIEDATARAAARAGIDVATVRIADPVGPAGAGLLALTDRLPLLPTVLGFDPPLQIVHEEDAAAAVAHVVVEGLTGPYLVAADGTLALSEAARLLGRVPAPLLPPWGSGLLAGILARAGLSAAPDLAGQLRHGRGIDNRRLKATGFTYRATTREALLAAEDTRRRRRVLHPGEPEPYDPEVEAFLRYSPSVRAAGEDPDDAERHGVAALPPEALLELLPSLDAEALRALRAHEADGPARPRILDEIDLLLERR